MLVQPGDLIFGDFDGVVVIPKKYEREVVLKALKKARGEKLVRKEIENGMSSTDAFRKYGFYDITHSMNVGLLSFVVS